MLMNASCYFLFADFWGPASNFGIPIAAIADMRKDPEMYVIIPAAAHHSLNAPPPRIPPF